QTWRSTYPGWVVQLERPTDVVPVLQAALEGRMDAALIKQIATDPWFTETLREAWPPMARHVAELVVTSHRGGSRTLDAIRPNVQDALDDWSHVLRTSFDDHAEAWY